MTISPDPNDLVAATNRLASEVERLGNKIRLSEKALERQRRWIRATLALVVLVALGGFWLWSVAGDARDAAQAAEQATAANKANAVRGCQNANESRVGARRLWLGVIDAPGPDGEPITRTPAAQAQVNDLRSFVEELYQQRDCSDLNRKYPLPELPDSLKPRAGE